MTKLTYKELETTRLILRFPRQTDYLYEFEYLRDKNQFPYADYKIAKTMEDVDLFFNRMLKDHLITSLFWMICIKETDEPIGSISAWNVDFDKNSIEFGYSIYPKWRGKGLMTEAISEVIRFCHEDLRFTLFDIWTHKDNTESIRLARRLGFIFKGYMEEQAKNSDEMIQYATYQLEKY